MDIISMAAGAGLGLIIGGFIAYFLARKTADEKLEMRTVELQDQRELTVRLQTEKTALNETNLRHAANLEEINKKFTLQFEVLANKIFDEKTSRFKKDSQEGLGLLLTPLKEKLQEFQKKVEDSFGTQAKEQFSLKEEIQRIVLANEKITTQAENLSNALKGNSKTQGDWGEIILETILNDAGLKESENYTVQGSGLGMQSGDGTRLKPDVIIHLPEKKHIIVDSKVSLTHYEQYFSEEGDQKQTSLKHFLASVRAHVNDLSQKNYQDSDKLNTPDFVLLFIPIEGAYALALQQDKKLHGYAWEKRIVIVCASTLFATLKTVASVWRMEQQNKNTQEIARQGGALFDEVTRFLGDMDDLGTHLNKATDAYEGAKKRLSSGKGNLLKRAKTLQDLGAKTTKEIPSGFFHEDPEEVLFVESAEKLDEKDEKAA